MTFFQFEADFVESLRCIPMQVRMNLDTCGVKLKLVHWNNFNEEEKQALVTKPCTTKEESQAYQEFLQSLVIKQTGKPAGMLDIDDFPEWLNNDNIPENVQEKAAEFEQKITLEQWQNLTPLQRFALIKLSRKGHENLNFYPALKEFNLLNYENK
jgi:hypothetical protein